jgi:hypothetical protein
MSNIVEKHSYYDKAVEAINQLKQAEVTYDEIIGQFIASGPVAIGQPIPSPKRILDINGMQKIKKAEANKMKAQKAVEQALDNYYNSKA